MNMQPSNNLSKVSTATLNLETPSKERQQQVDNAVKAIKEKVAQQDQKVIDEMNSKIQQVLDDHDCTLDDVREEIGLRSILQAIELLHEGEKTRHLAEGNGSLTIDVHYGSTIHKALKDYFENMKKTGIVDDIPNERIVGSLDLGEELYPCNIINGVYSDGNHFAQDAGWSMYGKLERYMYSWNDLPTLQNIIINKFNLSDGKVLVTDPNETEDDVWDRYQKNNS